MILRRLTTGSSSATGYLTNEVLNRPNLTYVTETAVQKVVFSTSSGQPPRVVGVEMNAAQDPQIYSCWAKEEVILCAGTVGTPQLLMLSGVGPAEDLQKLGISVVKDMPAVGQNVIDVRLSAISLFRHAHLLSFIFISMFHPVPFGSARRRA